MPKFGESSMKALNTANKELRDLFLEVVKTYDCSVLCGFRGQEDQDKAVASSKSKTLWPNSKHNTYPSIAVDVVPYPTIWPAPNQSINEIVKNTGRFYQFIGYVRRTAEQMGIKIRCGADWDGDFEIKDQNWDDLPHFELIK